jgi:outer membrane protein assembly factor BamB
MRLHRRTALSLALVLVVAGSVRAGDWPQWRGPNLNGSTDETNLPARWSKTENLAWVARMPGPSGATPIVLGDRVFVSSSSPRTDDLVGMCLSTKDGQMLWTKTLGRCKAPPGGEIAACSPASDGTRVYFTFGSGDLAALDLDGKILWSRDLVKDYGCLAIKFGYGASPLLHKGRLYLPLLRRDMPYSHSPGAQLPYVPPLKSYVLCLDAKTGKTIWKQARDTDAKEESRETYITPMAIDAKGRTEIIIPGGEFVTAHDSETGKELWRWEFTRERLIYQRVVVSPVIGDALVYVCQPRRPESVKGGHGLYALRPGGSGRIAHDSYAWKYTAAVPDVCTPLLYRGRLYVLAGDQKTMSCLDPKTGKAIWSEKIGGTGVWRASPTGADGKIYCISEGGDYLVLAAGDKFEELYRFSTKASPCRSSIVAANGSVFVRLSFHLLCVRGAPAGPGAGGSE